MKRITINISFFVLIFISISVHAQYRELIFYKFPVGSIKYFNLDETVIFKLKSESKYDIRKGTIGMITDTLFQIGNVRFKPDNLQWISKPATRGSKVIKNITGCIFLAGGVACFAYGILKFPDDKLKENSDAYHKENVNAISFSLAGIGIAAISIPIFQSHPKRYSVSKRWKSKYQH